MLVDVAKLVVWLIKRYDIHEEVAEYLNHPGCSCEVRLRRTRLNGVVPVAEPQRGDN